MRQILAIDYGTSTTSFAKTTDSSRYEPELLEIDGKRCIETAIRLDPSGEKVELIGSDVWSSLDDGQNRSFFNFKLDIASSKEWVVGGKTLTADDLGRMFLAHLRAKIEKQFFNKESLSNIIQCTIIGFPANWDEIQREATIKIAEEAGFPNVKGCEEPFGPIFYHNYKNEIAINENKKLIVYDFGGGTSDVCVVQTTPDNIPKILSTAGSSSLGGVFIDDTLINYYEKQIKTELNISELDNRDVIALKQSVKHLKEKFALAVEDGQNAVSVTIPMLYAKGSNYQLTLTKEIFESICKIYIEYFDDPLWSAVNKAEIQPADINYCILSGGSSAFYYVKQKIHEAFPNISILRSPNPQEDVVKGLALFGYCNLVGKARKMQESEKLPQYDTPESLPKASATREIPKETNTKSKKKMLITFGLIVVLCIAGFALSGLKQNKQTENTEAPVSPSVNEINKKVLNEFQNIWNAYTKSYGACNPAYMDALNNDLNKISVEDADLEFQELRRIMSSTFAERKKIEELTSKSMQSIGFIGATEDTAQDAFDQQYYDESKQYLLPERFRYKYEFKVEYMLEAIKNRILGHDNGTIYSRYIIKLDGMSCIPDDVASHTNYKDLGDGAPDLILVIAAECTPSDGETYYAVIDHFPKDGAQIDASDVSLNENEEYFLPSIQKLRFYVYDQDVSNGELLYYKDVPKENFSGTFNIGEGLDVKFSLEYSQSSM